MIDLTEMIIFFKDDCKLSESSFFESDKTIFFSKDTYWQILLDTDDGVIMKNFNPPHERKTISHAMLGKIIAFKTKRIAFCKEHEVQKIIPIG